MFMYLLFVLGLLTPLTLSQMGPVWILSTNGHGYALVQAPLINWTVAASQVHYYGNEIGYLATITTPVESAIIVSLAAAWRHNVSQFFVGARDINPNGVTDCGIPNGLWRWVTGPEANLTFYIEGSPPWAGTCLGYCNWCTTPGFLQPDNSTVPSSNCLSVMPFYGYTWNDAPVYYSSIGGYIVEFGGANSSAADVVIISANNVSTANISVQFLDCSPDHVITVRDSNEIPPQHVEFRFTQLIEHAANGTVLRGFNFSEAIFFSRHQPPSQPIGTQQFYFTGSIPYPNGTVSDPRISFIFTLSDAATIISYVGGALSVPPSSVKWEMEVLGWHLAEGHTLELEVSVTATPSIVSAMEDDYTSVDATMKILLEMADGSMVSLLLPTRAVLDANTTVMLESPPTYDANTSLLHFIFPAFNYTLLYDPSASILLGDGGSSSSSPNIALSVGLSVGLTAFALIIIMFGLLSLTGVVIYHKIVKPRARLKSINWSGTQGNDNM